jgi:hypothetical protein
VHTHSNFRLVPTSRNLCTIVTIPAIHMKRLSRSQRRHRQRVLRTSDQPSVAKACRTQVNKLMGLAIIQPTIKLTMPEPGLKYRHTSNSIRSSLRRVFPVKASTQDRRSLEDTSNLWLPLISTYYSANRTRTEYSGHISWTSNTPL